MRLPRPRFTLRSLIIAIALLAVAFGAFKMKERRDRALRSIAFHANLERKFGIQLAHHEREIAKGWAAGDYEGWGDPQPVRDFITYCTRMRVKWERAAARPWESVEPDPPQPNPTVTKVLPPPRVHAPSK